MTQARPRRTVSGRRLLVFLLIVVLLSLVLAHVVSLTGIWNTIIMRPMLNFLILTSKGFLGSFGIAVIVLTVLIRLLTLPLSMRQLRAAKTSQAIQPKITELQKKYANNKEQRDREIIKLYTEAGYNPLGCLVPTILQFPIWLALYQSVVQALAYTPENLVGLDKQLYHWTLLKTALPLNSHFLWLNLTQGNIVLVFVVMASVWMLQKMASLPTRDPRQSTMSRVMLWVMPLIFGFLAFTLPSGLSLYWVVSNVFGMIIQYRLTGWGTLNIPSLASLRRGLPLRVHGPPVKTKAGSTERKAARDATRQQDGASSAMKSPPANITTEPDNDPQVKPTASGNE